MSLSEFHGNYAATLCQHLSAIHFRYNLCKHYGLFSGRFSVTFLEPCCLKKRTTSSKRRSPARRSFSCFFFFKSKNVFGLCGAHLRRRQVTISHELNVSSRKSIRLVYVHIPLVTSHFVCTRRV